MVSGSGIRTAATTIGREPGDVVLAAPRGIVDAGEAGIGGNNVTIAANAIIGASNIDVSGVASGLPVVNVAVPTLPTVPKALPPAPPRLPSRPPPRPIGCGTDQHQPPRPIPRCCGLFRWMCSASATVPSASCARASPDAVDGLFRFLGLPDKMRPIELPAPCAACWQLCCLCLTPPVVNAWWDDHWNSRKQVSVDSGVTGADLKETLSDFPVLVRLHMGNFALFRELAEGGRDLRFYGGRQAPEARRGKGRCGQ